MTIAVEPAQFGIPAKQTERAFQPVDLVLDPLDRGSRRAAVDACGIWNCPE